jgi:hypothetical protein
LLGFLFIGEDMQYVPQNVLLFTVTQCYNPEGHTFMVAAMRNVNPAFLLFYFFVGRSSFQLNFCML